MRMLIQDGFLIDYIEHKNKMKKIAAWVTCYCGRGPYLVMVSDPVKCSCGVELHIQPKGRGWDGKAWGTASKKRAAQVYKDVQEGRSQLDAKWIET